MQATEALLEARKFAAFNRMSAFVVHDLKNIVTQLSLMMKNSQRLMSNPEFQNDMVLTVDNSLARMRKLMLQLQEGTVSSAPESGVDLAVLIKRLVSSAEMSGRVISFKLLSPAMVAAQEDRLERVLGHLVQNALEATAGGGTVQLSLDSSDVMTEIKLTDTGCGMSQAFISSNLFKPFKTTKQQGMGIGAYECSLYVQELGGAIQVDSALGAGTTITVRLPVMRSLAPTVASA
jgi:putative PEP-CTERM system histidine kinase